MNLYSKLKVRAICAVFIVSSLLFSLAACASANTGIAGTSDISAAPSDTGSTPSASPGTPAPSPSSAVDPFTDERIKALYADNNLSVMEIRDAGDYTMVHYYSLQVPNDRISRFDWFDRKTGARELVYGWIYADKFEITADKTLTVLTTGLSPADGGQSFPKLFTWRTEVLDGAVNASSSELDYFMPLDQGFTVGSERPESLKSVCFDSGSMLLTFDEQPGHETVFHAAVESIPRLNVTNKDGISTVTLYNTILSDDFVQTAGWMLGSDPSPVSVTCDGTDTVVTFRMPSDAGRYNISSFNTPVDCLPHAVISYVTTNQQFGYPKGW